MVRFRWLTVFSLCALLFLGGCLPGSDTQVPETQNKSYLRGKRYLREDRKDEALEAFLQVIAEAPADSPESHLEAGRLYQNTKKDPILAIYHYRKFLEQRPQGQEAPIVRQMIESAKKDFVAQLPGTPFGNDADRLDLLKMLQETRAENDTLKQELAEANSRLAASPRGPSSGTTQIVSSAATQQTQQQAAYRNDAQQVRSAAGSTFTQGNSTGAAAATPAGTAADGTYYPQGVTANMVSGRQTSGTATRTQPATQQGGAAAQQTQAQSGGQRSYIVQQGDTLSRISQRMYGTPGRWEEIFMANRGILATPHSLRVGQTLVIP